MNKLECMNTFVMVVESQSFAQTAKKQKCSVASISRQVSTLEETLGVQLLQRTTRRLSLTETGKEYYYQCKKMLQLLTETELAISASKKEATGILHVLSNRYFAAKYIVPRLKAFIKQNPKLKIKLELAERFPDLEQENIDILFGISMKGPDELIQRQVATTRYVLCASPEYLKSHGTPQTPSDLNQYQYLTHRMRTPDNVVAFDKLDVVVEPYMWLNDSHIMRECAIQSLGIVRLHDYVVADALKNKQLIEILPEFNQRQIPVFLYYQRNRYLQPKIRKFIDFFSD